MKITGPFVSTLKNKNPGPGNYDSASMKKNIAYSIRAKNIK